MHRLVKLGSITLGIVLLSACVPNRKVVIVQDKSPENVQEINNMYFVDEPVDNAIRQGDELYIKISSADENETVFDKSTDERIYDPALLSYTVDDQGYIKLPYVDKVKLSGLLLDEAATKIEKELSQYLYFPAVFIRFVNNKVTILGEVNRPGVYVFNYKSVNVLQAIGYAEDISIFGNRQKVLIIREEGDHRSKYELDLTSNMVLSSPYYNIKSNDVIYIEPLKRKKWGMSEFPWSLLLSAVSLTIVVLTFMVTYLK
jgi:polysaccharide export outer membrane protein